MATLLDTSALVVLLRRSPPRERAGVGELAAAEIRSRRAVVASVTVTELLVGARDARAASRLDDLLAGIGVVAADREIAGLAGRMGREARAAGGAIPLADLIIAATASFLAVPLLTCDADFARGLELRRAGGRRSAWRGFALHPASVLGP